MYIRRCVSRSTNGKTKSIRWRESCFRFSKLIFSFWIWIFFRNRGARTDCNAQRRVWYLVPTLEGGIYFVGRLSRQTAAPTSKLISMSDPHSARVTHNRNHAQESFLLQCLNNSTWFLSFLIFFIDDSFSTCMRRTIPTTFSVSVIGLWTLS